MKKAIRYSLTPKEKNKINHAFKDDNVTPFMLRFSHRFRQNHLACIDIKKRKDVLLTGVFEVSEHPVAWTG